MQHHVEYSLCLRKAQWVILLNRRTHEWLSGGVSPCQGEGRGFESRLVLSMIRRKRYPMDISFFVCSSPAGLERLECLRFAPVVAGERPPDVLRRLVLFLYKKEISVGYLLFSYIQILSGSNGSKSWFHSNRRRRTSCALFFYRIRHAQLGKEFPRCRAVALYSSMKETSFSSKLEGGFSL